MDRRSVVRGLAITIGGAMATVAKAQSRGGPIRILVGFPPGGGTDLLARLMAQRLQKHLNVPVIVENKPGAGGQLAAQSLKAAPPDGSTVMLTIEHTQVLVPLTMKVVGYDPIGDFAPLAGVATFSSCMVVSAQLPVTTMAQFRDWLHANPGKANFGVPAIGSVPQFSGFLVGRALGVEMTPVPYRGGAPLVTDLLSGQVPAAFGSVNDYLAHHRGGRMRILAVTGTRRTRSLPEVPTYGELGIQGLSRPTWTGFIGPKGLPEDFVARFTQAVMEVLREPDVEAQLAASGNDVEYRTPAEMQEWITTGLAHWGAVIRDAKFELQ